MAAIEIGETCRDKPPCPAAGATGAKDAPVRPIGMPDVRSRVFKVPAMRCNSVGSRLRLAGTSVEQIERFYARRLPLSREKAINLQKFGGQS